MHVLRLCLVILSIIVLREPSRVLSKCMPICAQTCTCNLRRPAAPAIYFAHCSFLRAFLYDSIVQRDERTTYSGVDRSPALGLCSSIINLFPPPVFSSWSVVLASARTQAVRTSLAALLSVLGSFPTWWHHARCCVLMVLAQT